MVKNMRLATKQMGGFLLISFITIIVATIGIYGLKNTVKRIQTINMASPLIDAAMEMKISVVTDMLTLMEITSSTSEDRLKVEWEAHEDAAKDFQTFADAILNGAETEEGTIYASKDESMRQIVAKASKIHKGHQQEDLVTALWTLLMKANLTRSTAMLIKLVMIWLKQSVRLKIRQGNLFGRQSYLQPVLLNLKLYLWLL